MGILEIRLPGNMLSLVLVSLMACASQAFLLDSLSGLTSQEKWDGLKTTWGSNPFSSEYFVAMPRTTKDAVSRVLLPGHRHQPLSAENRCPRGSRTSATQGVRH